MEDIKFKPRNNYQIDKKINMIIKLLKINDIPIYHLKDRLYFIGLYKLQMTLKGDFLLV